MVYGARLFLRGVNGQALRNRHLPEVRITAHGDQTHDVTRSSPFIVGHHIGLVDPDMGFRFVCRDDIGTEQGV